MLIVHGPHQHVRLHHLICPIKFPFYFFHFFGQMWKCYSHSSLMQYIQNHISTDCNGMDIGQCRNETYAIF